MSRLNNVNKNISSVKYSYVKKNINFKQKSILAGLIILEIFVLYIGMPLGEKIQKMLTSEQEVTFHRTSLPFILTPTHCLKTGKVWEKGQCWDDEHNPNF
jgi:hypothetical protein